MALVGKEYAFGDALYKMVLQMIENETVGYSQGGRLTLGSGPGEDGGDDDSPRPFVGQLAQRRVAYDTTQAEHPGLYGTLRSGWTNSLVDNLNHMRYWHKPARWFEPQFDGSYTVTVGDGFYWTSATQYLEYDGGTAVVGAPSTSGYRMDVLYVTKAGAAGVSQGTPTLVGDPTPTYPALDHIPVAEIFVKQDGDVTITTSGIDYYYASGTSAGYMYRDVRPFFGNTDPTAGGVEYLADLLDVTSETPSDNDVLAFDSDLNSWRPQSWMLGGIGGGQPTLQIDGPISVLEQVGGAYIATRSGEINSIYIYCKTPGISGATVVDANINGTTIFPNQGDRPSLAYNDANQVQRAIVLSGASFGPEDIFTIDIDDVAVEASGLTVVMALDIDDSHPHSGGPHTGVLLESEIRDSTISGYVLVGHGASPSGGPTYGQVSTTGLQNDAVTYAKIGDGVAKVQARQGGHATAWATAGTSNYDLDATDLKVQTGAVSVTVPGLTGSNPWKHKASVTITFPYTFSYTPIVMASPAGATVAGDSDVEARVDIISVTTSSVTIYAGVNSDVDRTFTINWMAIGAG